MPDLVAASSLPIVHSSFPPFIETDKLKNFPSSLRESIVEITKSQNVSSSQSTVFIQLYYIISMFFYFSSKCQFSLTQFILITTYVSLTLKNSLFHDNFLTLGNPALILTEDYQTNRNVSLCCSSFYIEYFIFIISDRRLSSLNTESVLVRFGWLVALMTYANRRKLLTSRLWLAGQPRTLSPLSSKKSFCFEVFERS